jgi:hypothetical protein
MEFKFSGRQEFLYIELLRQLTGAQRMRTARWMSSWEISRSHEEIARANPEFTDEQVGLKWVEITYGEELAKKLRDYLPQRQLDLLNANAAE